MNSDIIRLIFYIFTAGYLTTAVLLINNKDLKKFYIDKPSSTFTTFEIYCLIGAIGWIVILPLLIAHYMNSFYEGTLGRLILRIKLIRIRKQLRSMKEKYGQESEEYKLLEKIDEYFTQITNK